MRRGVEKQAGVVRDKVWRSENFVEIGFGGVFYLIFLVVGALFVLAIRTVGTFHRF